MLQGDAFDRPGDFAFGNPRTAHAHRQAVHFAGGLAGPFDLFDLRRLFYLAQRDDGARQFRRSVGRQPVGADAEQSAHRRTGFAAIRRQEEDAAAFGDNFNDVQMLEAVGMPYLMGNAPEALKERFCNHAPDNDHDGIAWALEEMGV